MDLLYTKSMRDMRGKITYGILACVATIALFGCHVAPSAGTNPQETIEEELLADTTLPTSHQSPEVEADTDELNTMQSGPVVGANGNSTDLETEKASETTTEPLTDISPEKPSQKPTQTPTQESMQVPTQAQTQTPTQQASTQVPTQMPTQAPTQMPTQAPTQKPTQASTQAPTQVSVSVNQEPQKTFDVGSNNDVYERATSMYDANLKRAEKMLKLINKYRAEKGLSQLELNEKLCYAAGMRAVEMDYGNYFGHKRYNGADNFTTIKFVGLKYSKCGEILATNCINCEEAFNLWKNSPTHNNIILNAGYKKMGLGYCNKKGHMIWVIQFTD